MKKLLLSLILVILLITSVSAVFNSSLKVGLRAYYTLDETGSDNRLNSIDGALYPITVTGTLNGGTGISGNYWGGNDDGNYGSLPAGNILGNPQGLTGLTISWWYNSTPDANGGASDRRFFSNKNDGSYLDAPVTSGGNPSGIGFTFNGESRINTGVININNSKWHLITFTATNNSRGLLYIDGVLNANISAGNFSNKINITNFGWDGVNTGTELRVGQGMDEFAVWNRTLDEGEVIGLYNGGVGIFYTDLSPSINATQNTPANGISTIVTTPSLSCNFTSTNQNISSVRINVWDSTGNLDYTNTESGLTTTSYNKTWTSSLLGLGTYNWSCTGYGSLGVNDTTGNRTLTITSFIENSRSLNFTTYQTAYEGFSINVNGTITSAKLNYDGTNYDATQDGSNWIAHVLIPSSSSGNKTLYWNLTSGSGSSISSSSYQYIYPIDLVLCNSTSTVKYLNITFQDELTSVAINGTLSPLTITYYLYNSSSYKTLSYTNTSILNPVYSFCLTPSFKTLVTSLSGSSSTTGYPVRSWINTSTLTNNTLVKAINLLSSSDGVYQAVVVTNSGGTALQGATVSASTPQLGIIDSRITDVSGTVTLWLDPNKAHTLTTSLTGYPTDIRTINPSPSTTIYVALGGTTTYPANLSYSLTEGIVASFEPIAETVYNETTYSFKFILSSNYWTISQYGFDLYNSSGTIVGSTSANTNGGTLTINYNVLNNTRMDAKGYYIINGTTRYFSDSWNVMNSADTQYSISFLKDRISTYIDSGFFGLKKGAGLNIFCFIIIFITIGSLSWKFGISEPTIIAVMTTLMVWFFEVGLGLITGMGNIPMTVWVAIPTAVLLFKEGLKLI